MNAKRMDPPNGSHWIVHSVLLLSERFTDDHPAYEYVRPWITEALDGPNVLLVHNYHPLRAQYIMTHDFGVREVGARNAVHSFIRSPARIIGATDSVLLEAYEISAQKQHDVYDSFVLALARAQAADYLVTTDTDFERLCENETVDYRNPIPEDELDILAMDGGA